MTMGRVGPDGIPTRLNGGDGDETSPPRVEGGAARTRADTAALRATALAAYHTDLAARLRRIAENVLYRFGADGEICVSAGDLSTILDDLTALLDTAAAYDALVVERDRANRLVDRREARIVELHADRDALAARVAGLDRDAQRYRRLRILGAAPGLSKQLEQGTVLVATNLDRAVDEDMRVVPSRGEADAVDVTLIAPPAPEGPCSCHLGSVCGPACEQGRCHTGCPQEAGRRE